MRSSATDAATLPWDGSELKLHCCPSGNGGSKTAGCKVRLYQASTWSQVGRRGLEEELCPKAVETLCVVADEEKTEEEESALLVAVAVSKIDAEVAFVMRKVGIILICFYSEMRHTMVCVSAVFASRVLSQYSKSDASRQESLCVFST